MNPDRLRPQKKIDELLLLMMIREYKREHMDWPPTAVNLFDFKMRFAPSLSNIDTLRQWLLRHRGRTIRILPHYRPFRYELTRQGDKRITYLQDPARHIDFKQLLERALKRHAQNNVAQQLLFKSEIDRREEERRYLLKVIEDLASSRKNE